MQEKTKARVKADLWVETRRNKLQSQGLRLPPSFFPQLCDSLGFGGQVRIGQGEEWLGMSSSTELCLSEETGQERREHSQDGVVGRRQESLSLP